MNDELTTSTTTATTTTMSATNVGQSTSSVDDEITILLPESILDNSPSSKHDISADTERQYRIFGCELVQEMGVLLRLPQVVMVTGQTLFHRFFYRKSLARYDAPDVAMTAIFLAAKIEECFAHSMLHDVLKVYNVCEHLRNNRKHELLRRGGPRYTALKKKLLSIERYLLKELGFSLTMDHPHKYILHFIKYLELEGDKEFSQTAWNFVNDGMRLDLCVRFPSAVIASAAIYMAAEKLGRVMPLSPPWYHVFGASLNDLQTISGLISALYSEKKIAWLPSLRVEPPTPKVDVPKPVSGNLFGDSPAPPPPPPPANGGAGKTSTASAAQAAAAAAAAAIAAAVSSNGANGASKDAPRAGDDKKRQRKDGDERNSSSNRDRRGRDHRDRDRDRRDRDRDRDRDRRDGRDRRDRGGSSRRDYRGRDRDRDRDRRDRR